MKFNTLVIALLILLLIPEILVLRFNFTDSMPIGIYKKIRPHVLYWNDYVAFCLPKSIARVGKESRYIGSGFCSYNSTPLLKKVIALPGDTVVLSQNAITVNGVRYYAPQQKFDHNHQPIKHWIKNGIYHPKKDVWVYGSHDPIHSWDSRYFGGIPVKNIQGIYKALWTFNP